MTQTKKAKYTPGPWFASGSLDSRNIGFHYTDEDGNRHAGSVALVDCHRGELNEANARLIAAAPELAEALRELKGWVEGLLFNDAELLRKAGYELRKAEAALRKAGY